MDGLDHCSRTYIQDANDMLDALEEAEDAAAEKAKANRETR